MEVRQYLNFVVVQYSERQITHIFINKFYLIRKDSPISHLTGLILINPC